MSKLALKGNTAFLILGIVTKNDMYGYQIIKQLKENSNGIFTFKEGTLYPILHSLEIEGFLSSYWKEIDNMNRKYYTITKSGKKKFKILKDEWQNYKKAVDNIVGGVNFDNVKE